MSEIDKLNAEERDLRQDVNRAALAKSIMDNEMVVAAFDDIEKMLLDTIKESETNQPDIREAAYQQIKAMTFFKDAFKKHLSDGEFADHRIKEIKAQRKTLMQRMGLRA